MAGFSHVIFLMAWLMYIAQRSVITAFAYKLFKQAHPVCRPVMAATAVEPISIL